MESRFRQIFNKHGNLIGVIIKLILLNIVILFLVQLYSQPYKKTNGVFLNYKEKPLRSILEELSTQNSLYFVYGNNLVDKIKVTCHIDSSNMKSALHKLLSGYNISYKVFNNNSYVLFKETNPKENTFRTVVVKQNLPAEDLKNLITEPKIISKSQPAYPADAVKYNIEGKVIVKLYVNKEGDITNMYISRSSGFAVLDSATTNYAGKLKFSPALENGEPKNIWVSMTFDYRLINK